MPFLNLKNISKIYSTTNAITELSLDIEQGEIFGLLGKSGSGKTTLLRLIAGLEKPNKGTIECDGNDITKLKPEKRGFGMVFQSHALFPHLSVADNIAFGLKTRKFSKAKIKERVEKMLSFVRLSGYEKRRIEELSGGEQQRVAIARALAIEPKLLLFDEPFSNLDVGLREKTRSELRELIKRLGLTAAYVTHDQQEVFDLCDRMGILEKGQLLQIGTPREIYESPDSVAVASFLGNNNLFQAMRLTSSKTKIHEFRTLIGEHQILASVREGQKLSPINKPVTLSIRPEEIKFFSGASFPGDNVLKARVADIHFSGATTIVRLDVGGLILEALVLRLVGLSVGDEILVGLPPENIKILAG
jgi:ABC-type Fe3+/spermidine/putrescine transport system ATPase subunit